MSDGFGLLIFLAVISGLVGIYVDKRCHRTSSGQEGFWHGLFFGPIGWLLIALYPPNPFDRPPGE